MTEKEKTAWLAAVGVTMAVGGILIDQAAKAENPLYDNSSWQKWVSVGLIGLGGIVVVCAILRVKL